MVFPFVRWEIPFDFQSLDLHGFLRFLGEEGRVLVDRKLSQFGQGDGLRFEEVGHPINY